MAQPQQAAAALDARAAMERLNAEAGKLHIWLRTQANAPAQPPWFRATGPEAQGSLAEGRVGAAQLKPLPHLWRWREISPYLDRIAEIARAAETPPIEFAERQQFLLTNPGLGGRLQVSATMRCAVSIYNPGDIAPVHIHTPNASRTILSRAGGYTVIEGERVEAERGDLILTPNGTWHDHGNDGENPVVWMDVLDFPLLEFLDCVWLDEAYPAESGGNARTQAVTRPRDYSQKLYGHGGIIPGFVAHRRGFGRDGLREEAGDPYEGITVAFVNPTTGMPLFPTLGYSAQLLRAGEATRWKRETASTLYLVIAGRGHTEIGRRRFEWEENDIFVVPGFLWRRHVNSPDAEAVLYAVSDRPLLDKIGQYRAQGRLADGTVVELPS